MIDDELKTDDGMVLVNVLAVVALASAVVVLMVATQDLSLHRSLRLREATQADAYARAGELSAITALRRDMLTAPQTDNSQEAWAKAGQSDVAIQGGRFRVVITDAQGRFNINNVRDGGAAAQQLLTKLMTACGAEDAAPAVIAYVQALGPVSRHQSLKAAGLDDRAAACLAKTVTALPKLSPVNLNSAEQPLLAALLSDATTAALLVSARRQRGFLTSDDLSAAKVIMPLGSGLTSDWYQVQTQVTVGGTTVGWSSLVERTRRENKAIVHTVDRKIVAAEPVKAPPL